MMTAQAIVDPLVRALRVADLRSYLLSRGWQVKPFKRPQVIYFEGPPDDEGKPLVQLVPASEQLRDYQDRIEEQAFFRRALKKAVQFAECCRLRPAVAGSFMVEVETPLIPPANEMQVRLKAYPLERLILISLMEGLGDLQQAFDTGDKESIFSGQPRINANMCEALLGMRPDSPDVKLEVGVSWSTAWPLEDRDVPRKVIFERQGFEQIDSIGRALRTGTEPPAAGGPPLKLVARATIDGKEVIRETARKLPRVLDKPDIVTTVEQSEVAVQPGGQVRLTVKIDRKNGFSGRVPIDVQGLPHGVRVLDIGLNGILITPTQNSRTIVIYAEPWVKPTEHPFVVLARGEKKNAEYAARSVLLRVGGK